MNEDDVTRDGLPRFIYGEYTGEMPLPVRPEPEEDEAPASMDRRTKILVGSGGLALLLIVGLVVAALSTGGGGDTPAVANPESPAPASSQLSTEPSPTVSPEPTQSWPMATDLGDHGGSTTTAKPTKTAGKPVTTAPTNPEGQPTTPKVPLPPKPSRSHHG
ncbi:hypothetical protein AB0M46_37995 [Dactylosporangium sp. NPDC051485]|uniref:hypothetical protein n=1 Tax=Dactylosporangium sp. NPDC051485 TaxID=3154846 RepID=UPI003421B20A